MDSLIVASAVGATHSLILTGREKWVKQKFRGAVLGKGDNLFGQLGGERREIGLFEPIANLSKEIIAIAAGDTFSMALSADGEVLTWGENLSGQLGDGTRRSRSNPGNVEGISKRVIKIAAGCTHSLALTEEGEVFAWGNNFSGQLGDGTTQSRNTPKKMENLDKEIVEVSGSFFGSLALTKDGQLWGWGVQGGLSQVVGGNIQKFLKPKKISGFNCAIVEIASGYDHSLALSQEGRLYSWGGNGYGQLGDGTRNPNEIPTLVKGIHGKAVKVAVSYSTSLVQNEEDEILIWGRDHRTYFGDIESKAQLSPDTLSGVSPLVSSIVFGPGGRVEDFEQLEEALRRQVSQIMYL